MKREIKFRAWSNHHQCFVKEEHLMWSSNRNGINTLEGISIDRANDDMDDEVEFQQFTGLKDKNGKEIYEGDILTGVIEVEADEQVSSRGNFSRKKNFDAIVEIKYSSLDAAFVPVSDQVNVYKSGFMKGCGSTKRERDANFYKDFKQEIKVKSTQLSTFEIIGNIYENKELITH